LKKIASKLTFKSADLWENELGATQLEKH